jgi:hypothetical protein
MRGMGIAAEAWWEVAKNSRQNRAGLSWEIELDVFTERSLSITIALTIAQFFCNFP